MLGALAFNLLGHGFLIYKKPRVGFQVLKSPFRLLKENFSLDVKAVWQRHLLPRWSPGLIRLIWVSPSSLLHVHPSWHYTKSKRKTFPTRGGSLFSQGYTSSRTPLLGPPNKLSGSICRTHGSQTSKAPDTSTWGTACGCLPFFMNVVALTTEWGSSVCAL